jgi:hypothetical protein
MPVYLHDFAHLSEQCREFDGSGLGGFLRDDRVRSLDWPDDVAEQWLYDFAGWGRFQDDYGHLDLATITWHDELVPAEEFLTMPTGPSDGDLIDENAANAHHWSEVRRHLGVPQHWESHGTWMRRPLLADRTFLYPGETGLQVIEGRTRVGILRGFMQRGRSVAPVHQAWVARLRNV